MAEDIDLRFNFEDGSLDTALDNVTNHLKEIEKQTERTGKAMSDNMSKGAEATKKADAMISGANKSISDQNKELDAAAKQFNQYGRSIGDSITELGLLEGGIARTIATLRAKVAVLVQLRAGFIASSRAAGVLRVALISTGIGAIIVALGSLIAFLTGTQRGMDILAKISTVAGVVFERITTIFEKFGEVIFDTFTTVEGFQNALKSLGDFLIGQIVNRFNAVINIVRNLGSALYSLATGDFEGLKQATIDTTASFVALNTGFSESQIKEFASDVVGLGQELSQAAKDASALADEIAGITRAKILFNAEEAALSRTIEEQKEILSDTNKSYSERNRALSAARAAEEQRNKKQLEFAKKDLELLDRKLKASGKDVNKLDNDDLEERVKLQVEISKLEGQSDRTKKQLNKTERGLRNEAAAAAKARRKEEEDAAKALLKANEDLAKVFQQIDDERKKRGIDQLKGQEKLNAEKELALELEARQIAAISAQIDEAEKAGVKQSEIAKRRAALIEFEKDFRLLTEKEFNDKAVELDKERREKELKEFLASSDRKLEIEKIRLQNAGQTQGLSGDSIRLQILEAEQKAINEAYDAEFIALTGKLEEQLKLTEEFDIKLGAKEAELRKARFDARFNALDQEEQLRILELDLVEASTDKRLTLETFKEKAKLDIQLEFAKKRLEALTLELGPASPEVRLLEQQIKSLQKGIENVVKGADPFAALKESLIKSLGLNEGQFAMLTDSYGQLFNQFKGYIDQISAEADARLQQISDRKNEVQEELEEEEQRQKDGFASNVTAKKAELAQLAIEEKKAQEEAAKRKKEALRLQLITEGAQQASSIATAIAQLITGWSSLPFGVGVAIGLAQAGILIATIASMRARIKASTAQKLFKGNFLGRVLPEERDEHRSARSSGMVHRYGRTDRNGGKGYKVLGTDLEIGGDEYLLNGVTTSKQMTFMDKLNAGRYDRLNLAKLAEEALSGGKALTERVNVLHVKHVESQAQKETITEAMMSKIMKKHSAELIWYFNNEQEKATPIHDGKYLVKKGNIRKVSDKPYL